MIEMMLHVRLIFYSIRAQTFEIVDDSVLLKNIDLIYHISPTQLLKYVLLVPVVGEPGGWISIVNWIELGSLEFW